MHRTRLRSVGPILCVLLLLLPCFAVAQLTAGKDIALNYTVPSNLVQGRIYSPNYFPIKGSPFLTENWTSHDFELLDNTYYNMPSWYDIYADDLILLYQQRSNLLFVRLNQNQVRSFRFDNREFVNIAYSSYRETGLPGGYYELLIEGEVDLLVKRRLLVEDNSQDWSSSFYREDRWYMWLDGQMYSLRNKKSFLNAIGEANRKEAIRFAKKNGIRFRRAGDQEWMQMVGFLNTQN